MSRTVRVGLGDRAYDVVVGGDLLDQAGVLLAPLLKQGRTAIVSDETVWGLHGARLTAALAAAKPARSPTTPPPKATIRSPRSSSSSSSRSQTSERPSQLLVGSPAIPTPWPTPSPARWR